MKTDVCRSMRLLKGQLLLRVRMRHGLEVANQRKDRGEVVKTASERMLGEVGVDVFRLLVPAGGVHLVGLVAAVFREVLEAGFGEGEAGWRKRGHKSQFAQ
jgi:hypothetical protein